MTFIFLVLQYECRGSKYYIYAYFFCVWLNKLRIYYSNYGETYKSYL